MSLYTDFLDDSNYSKVLEVFLENDGTIDVSVSQVCEETKLSRKTVDKIFEKMIKNQSIILTRRIGKTNLYAINKRDARVKALIKLFKTILKTEVDLY